MPEQSKIVIYFQGKKNYLQRVNNYLLPSLVYAHTTFSAAFVTWLCPFLIYCRKTPWTHLDFSTYICRLDESNQSF